MLPSWVSQYSEATRTAIRNAGRAATNAFQTKSSDSPPSAEPQQPGLGVVELSVRRPQRVEDVGGVPICRIGADGCLDGDEAHQEQRREWPRRDLDRHFNFNRHRIMTAPEVTIHVR